MPKRPPRVIQETPLPSDLRGEISPMRTAISTKFGTLWLADAIELLTSIESQSADLVIADPPYAIGKDQWDRFASMEHYLNWCTEWLTEVVSRAETHWVGLCVRLFRDSCRYQGARSPAV